MLSLSILAYFVLRSCLKDSDVGKTNILAGVTLDDLAGNWLATLGEKLGSHSLQSASQWMNQFEGAGGILPLNEDLAISERLALGNVLQAFHLQLHAQQATLSPPERHWLLLFGDLVKELTKKSASDSAQATCQRLQARLSSGLGISPAVALLQPGQPDIEHALSTSVHTTCLTWLEDEVQRLVSSAPAPSLPAYPADAQPPAIAGMSCPEMLRGWFLHPAGFSLPVAKWGDRFRRLLRRPPVQRPLIQGTFLQLWASSYLEQIKSTPRSFSQHLLDCLAALKHDQPQHTAAMDAAAQRIEASVTTTLGSLHEQLASLLGITTGRFTELSTHLASQAGQTHTLLTDLLTGHAEQSAAWSSVQRELGTIKTLLEEEHAPPLDTSFKDPTGAQGAEAGFSKLLYRERWLPTLLSREHEMETLIAFLESSVPYAIHVLVGEAGMGKSRLAFELMLRAQTAGWRAGFLQSSCRLDDDRLLHRWLPTVSTLLIVDYASEQGAPLAKALAQMALNENEFQGRLRILLIDRSEALAVHLNDFSMGKHVGQDPNKEKVRQRLHLRLDHVGDARTAPYNEKTDALCLKPLRDSQWQPFLLVVFARAGHPQHLLPRTWKKDVARATDHGRPLMLTVLGLHYLRHNADAADRRSMDDLLDELIRGEVHHRWLRALRENSRRQPAAQRHSFPHSSV